MGLFTRSIRPDPASVGPDVATPGDPHGLTIEGDSPPYGPPPPVLPQPWSGWPADWGLAWGQTQRLTGTAWACVDLNASVLASMPPYLVNAAPTLDSDWLRNPDPDVYSSWDEFAKQLFWSYQLGEAFVLATARYATGWPVRFHVVPPWAVEVELAAGIRRYTIGRVDYTADILHVRYQSAVDDAHGHGPLEAGALRLVAAELLARYSTGLASSGGIPSSVLEHPDELSAEQSRELQAQWVQARMSTIGEPAVLSGGVTWKPTQMNPVEMALLELQQFNESRIAVMLGVPPFLVGLPSGGDSMTYSNVTALFDYHWRAGLRPKASAVMSALSEWALPRGTTVELNRDEYVQADPKSRAEIAAIYSAIVDSQGNPVMSVEEIRRAERLDTSQQPVGVLQ